MGIFDKTFGTLGRGLGDVIGAVARKVKYASWEGARSPYGLPIPIAYGVTWVTPIQVYSGEQFTWYSGVEAGGAATMRVPVYTVDNATGEVSIEEQGETCQSAVLVLCESAIDVLDILKDGVSINSGHIDNADITTVTQRLRMISGRIPNPEGIIPPTGEESGYFHGGTGAATAHTRFSRTANLGAAPYTYSDVARVDLCALGIGGIGQRPSLKFLVQGELATSSTVGAHPADVLMDLWERAGKDPADLDVETYYRAYVTGGGGSGSTAWRVNRTIDSQTPARELMQSLLDETFATVVKKEDGTLLVVPRDVAAGTATAIGVNDFVDKPPVTVELKQASDCFNCVPVDYEVTTASGTHSVRNEDTTFAVGTAPTFADAHPFSATETIRRAPPLSTTWVSTAEHALNLSLLLGRESFNVRATYKFRLHKRWVLFQEHDLLSLTEPHLGLSAKVVKIRRISEGADGVISIEADEWFGQVTYTTPEVDPFDGFTPLPGIPRDPSQAAIDAMSSDGEITPAEKPGLFNIISAIFYSWGELWHASQTQGGWMLNTQDAALQAPITALWTYLTTYLGFNANWCSIDWVWADDPDGFYGPTMGGTSTDRTEQRALLAAWMLTTNTVVAETFRAKFSDAETAVTKWKELQLAYLGSQAGLLEVLVSPTGTTTFLRADGEWVAPIYDLVVFSNDAPEDAAILGRWAIAHSISFAANFAGSNVSAGTAATASTVLSVKKNGTEVGTLTFAASGTIPTMDCTAWTCAADDIITIENQATADATLALISITLAGVRTA